MQQAATSDQTPVMDYSDDYDFLNRSAHRYPAMRISAPAVTRHLAFRKPPKVKLSDWQDCIEGAIKQKLRRAIANGKAVGHDVEISDLDGIQRLNKIPIFSAVIEDREAAADLSTIEFIRSRHGVYEAAGTTRFFPIEVDDYFHRRYQHFSFVGVFRGLHYWVLYENFDEYFTVTGCIELSDEGGKTNVAALDSLVTAINTKTETKDYRRRFDATGSSNAAALFDLIWTDFETVIGLEPVIDEEIETKLVGRCKFSAFQDLRGLILGAREKDDAAAQGRPLKLKASDDKSELIDTAILPILLSVGDVSAGSDPAFNTKEYSISSLAEEKFLFGTGFSSIKSDDVPGKIITYVNICFRDDRRQIGRMTSRIHTLETLRLASLFDLPRFIQQDRILSNLLDELGQYDDVKKEPSDVKIEESTSKLMQLRLQYWDELRGTCEKIDFRFSEKEADLKNFIDAMGSKKFGKNEMDLFQKFVGERSTIHCLSALKKKLQTMKKLWREQQERASVMPISDKTFKPDVKLKNHLRDAVRYCEKVQASDYMAYREAVLAQVRRALWKMDGKIVGGIAQRMAAMRYAQKLFEALSEAMRIERVPGYQPYNLFVQHRLERVLAFLERVNAKYRSISNREIHLRTIVDREKSNDHQKDIKDLQKGAERGFFFILFPYYFGHVCGWLSTAVAEHFIEPYKTMSHEDLGHALETLRSTTEASVSGLILLGCVIVYRGWLGEWVREHLWVRAKKAVH